MKTVDIKINVEYTDSQLIKKLSKASGIPEKKIDRFEIVRQSVDARDKSNVCFAITANVFERGGLPSVPVNTVKKIEKKDKRIAVVGSGPAGLFAALTLARNGFEPIVIERGGKVDERKASVDFFRRTGVLDTESNVQFGEGGAGTFSDGKLNTGINDKRIRLVLETFAEAGAPEEILRQAKPHIGTDKLCETVKNLRNKIIALGGVFIFNALVSDIITDGKKLTGLLLTEKDGSREIQCDAAIFAIGHSARDTVRMLLSHGVVMEKKPFAVGLRIEHPRKMIDEAQYGKFVGSKRLGAADYKLVAKTSTGRGVYTFCMCPGGVVMAASSEKEMLAVNGMSEFARDAENSNSALLVGITPADTGDDLLGGMKLQQELERKAYLLGGGNYKAPVEMYGDFVRGANPVSLGDVAPSYLPGVTVADLRFCLPGYVSDSIAEAIGLFGRKIKGFDRYDAVLTGVESRSSSPVRIVRNELFESSLPGLYPCGEGAGYAGGITSAAVDGIRCAEALVNCSEL